MATIIRSCDGDVLDTLCHAHYGHLPGVLEAVYGANPGLAALPQPFASGVLVTLPDLPQRQAPTIQLWT